MSLTVDLLEDVARLFYQWKKKPRKIKPQLHALIGLSPEHEARRAALNYWVMAALRHGISAAWWLDSQTKKSPPPFARIVLEILVARYFGDGGLSGRDAGLGMAVIKRHFPKAVCGWAYHLIKKMNTRAPEAWLADAPPAVRAALPAWMFERIKTNLSLDDDLCARACRRKNVPHPLSVRVNPAWGARDRLVAALAPEACGESRVRADPHASNPWGAYISGYRSKIEENPHFVSGDISVQAESSIVAPMMIQRLGLSRAHILDMAAAPGGKTLLMWQLLKDTGLSLTAMARDARAEEVLRRNIGRDASCRARVIVHDVTRGAAAAIAELFDLVLCDVPCSNTGTVFSKPDVRYLHDEGGLRQLVDLQYQFLIQAESRVRLGGYIVYVACSCEPEEGDGVIGRFVAGAAGRFEIARPPAVCAHLRATRYGVCTEWFAQPYWDGYYIAILRKRR